MHQKNPHHKSCHNSTFSREGGRTQHLPWWPWLCSKRSGGIPGLPFGAVAKNAKHDLLFLWTLRFLVGIVSWDCSWYEKTQRVFHNSLWTVFSFLMFGSDLFVLFFFFRGHFSFDFTKQIGYIAPSRFVWDPQHLVEEPSQNPWAVTSRPWYLLLHIGVMKSYPLTPGIILPTHQKNKLCVYIYIVYIYVVYIYCIYIYCVYICIVYIYNNVYIYILIQSVDGMSAC